MTEKACFLVCGFLSSRRGGGGGGGVGLGTPLLLGSRPWVRLSQDTEVEPDMSEHFSSVNNGFGLKLCSPNNKSQFS